MAFVKLKQIKLNKKELPLILASFFATYIIWGSTYMANKVVVMEMPPFLLASIRFLSAAVIVFAIAALLRKPLLPTRSQLKNAFIAGFLFLTFGNGLAVWALQYVESAFSAIIISAQPLVLLVLMRVMDKKRIKARSIIGVSLGMLGIYLLVSQQDINTQPDMWKGLVALLFCLVAWGYGSIFVAKADLPPNVFVNGAWQMLCGGVMKYVVSLLLGESTENLAQISSKAMYAMGFLIVFGSIIAFTAFNYLLTKISPEKVATNTYINPIVAMLVGWYFLDEKITQTGVLATVVLLIGVYFINSVRFSQRKKALA